MSSLSSVSFVVLINGGASVFFKAGRGLRQGCPLAPLLFIIIAEGLSRAIYCARDDGIFHGISFDNNISLTHVIFVDDVIMVSDGLEQSLSSLYEILLIYCKASSMQINDKKSALYHSGLDEYEIITLQNIFSFPVLSIENGMKYLGFFLKPCRYVLKDWDWLIAKVEKRILNWSFCWLTKGGKLTLIKSILEAILIYWMHFWIHVGVYEKIRKLCFRFLWSGHKDSAGLPWTS